MAKLAEKSAKVLAYLQENDNGEGISIAEVATALDMDEKSVRPVITLSLGRAPKDGTRGILVEYQKREVEGAEKPVGYAVLTEEGKNFVESED